MRRFLLVGLAGLAIAAVALGQVPASSQANSNTSSRASVDAQQMNLRANSSFNAGAAQHTNSNPQQPAQQPPDRKQTSAKASSSASAQGEARTPAGGASADLSSGSTIEATLTRPLDCRKNKPGDTAEAKVTKDVKSDGQVIIPKGSRLLGHVTEAQAKSKTESESTLGVVFDHARLKDGREIPVHALIQAVAAAESTTAASAGGGDLMAGSSSMGRASGSGSASGSGPAGGGLLGGVTSTVGATAGAVTSTTGSLGQTAGATLGATSSTAGSATGGNQGPVGSLTSSTAGVIGLQGLNLNTEGSNSSQGSLISSPSRNVRLDSGTRLLLRIAGEKEQSKEKQ